MYDFGLDSEDLEAASPIGHAGLPHIRPRFFVPPLADKPQNPIMDTLKLASINTSLPQRPMFPPELVNLATDLKEAQDNVHISREMLWKDAVTRNLGSKNQTLSWDRLRPSHSSRAISTPFLSEQDSLVFASARYNVLPRLHDAATDIAYVSQEQLLPSLKMMVLGTSSTLHMWDVSSERFVQVGAGNGKQRFLLVDGKDEVISSSVISRFVTIGTLLRRLEAFISTLRRKSALEGPTIHAFAHSLSTILGYMREKLSWTATSSNSLKNGGITAVWMEYGIYEDIVVALSAFYGRDENLTPENYLPFDPSPVSLLSGIYDHLSRHFEWQSPRIIRAIFAFILTSASREYLQEVAHSVGFGGQPSKKPSHATGERHDPYSLGDEEEEEEEDIFDALEKIEDTFPTLFPEELLNTLPAAQKSLVLLRAAQPDHPLLNLHATQATITWLWQRSAIQGSWSIVTPESDAPEIGALTEDVPPLASPMMTYKPELIEFAIFDLEPGVTAGNSTLKVKDMSVSTLQTFIDGFPDTLPSITPTLSHLTSLVFAGLVRHASTLSSALLSLFLSSPGNLNFRSHIVLLRSYLLLTAESFKSRLSTALFSDAGGCEIENKAHSMTIRSLRRKSSNKLEGNSQPWAVGLAPSLLERETWPPVGADLSFVLRTVIVDSFEKTKDWDDGGSEEEQVAKEAGWRLGFAIRDLPIGPGRDKWLNPLYIEALDFLYMDYKPPHPLEILITPEVMSKYQRIFTFNLRLMRVENAIKSLYRMTRRTAKPLFPTLAAPRKLLLHFRFLAQGFVSCLSQYVFDTAIGGNFDLFVARLSREGVLPGDGSTSSFGDVFELASAHSMLLDDILSACLLRSGQKGVGELLRQALELILEFCVVAGELHRHRLEEYQAGHRIENILQKFRAKITTLIKVLKGLVDKNSSSSRWVTDQTSGGQREPPGGAEALYHLLVRLDLTDYWSKTN